MIRLRPMEATNASGSIVLLTRLARVVYRASTEELLGIRLKELATRMLRDYVQDLYLPTAETAQG